MLIGKKRNQLLWNFFNELTQPFLSLNLPQNKFHKKLRKIIINFHPKILWHQPKITFENIVQTDMKKFIYFNQKISLWSRSIASKLCLGVPINQSSKVPFMQLQPKEILLWLQQNWITNCLLQEPLKKWREQFNQSHLLELQQLWRTPEYPLDTNLFELP